MKRHSDGVSLVEVNVRWNKRKWCWSNWPWTDPIFVLIHSERFATVGTFINFMKSLTKVRRVLQAFEIRHLLYKENYFIWNSLLTLNKKWASYFCSIQFCSTYKWIIYYALLLLYIFFIYAIRRTINWKILFHHLLRFLFLFLSFFVYISVT